MGILLWIIFGALTGWLASLVLGTDAQQGALANIVIGILGAMIGGFIFTFFGFAGITGFNLYSIFVAVFGSVVLIFLASLLR